MSSSNSDTEFKQEECTQFIQDGNKELKIQKNLIQDEKIENEGIVIMGDSGSGKIYKTTTTNKSIN